MKTCEDMTRDVLDRVHAYQRIQKKRRAALRTGVAAGGACLALAAGILLWQNAPAQPRVDDETPSSDTVQEPEDIYGGCDFGLPDRIPYDINGVTYWGFPNQNGYFISNDSGYTLTRSLDTTVIRKATKGSPGEYILPHAEAYATAEDDDVVVLHIESGSKHIPPTQFPLFRDGAPCLIRSFDQANVLAHVPPDSTVEIMGELEDLMYLDSHDTVYRIVVCWCRDGRQVTDAAALRQKFDDLVHHGYAPVLEQFGDQTVLSLYAYYPEIERLQAANAKESYALFLYGEYFNHLSTVMTARLDGLIRSDKAKDKSRTSAAISYYAHPRKTHTTPLQ